MRRELPQRLLRELLKDSKRSDRELAKVLGVSQPTITRVRHKLEKDGIIQDYTIIPDFKKLGFEIFAVTLVKLRPGAVTPESIAKASEAAGGSPNAILSCLGEGMGMNGMALSFHKNYTDYHQHLNQLRMNFKDFLDDVESFIVSIGEGEFKRFSLTHLKDVPF